MTEWCVVVMDKPGAERKKYGSLHVTGIKPIIKAGILLSGGQINDESNPPKAVGSHLQIRADTKQDVVEMLQNDPFSRYGVWDIDNAIIYRLDCVYRERLDLTL
ncbi:similar to Meyerozyma guilliermondii PGUG_01654 hypothetical protein [Maudiozyma saulgeensis]|uniref:YCII-related domain-containing protein n=1 Tax=Maudiozyma saulgeensis TaxID=1789683 RepID=A0A1X7RAD3_9SACH|nr:similar to Meyerozyma guilliermondii PGUG_01654 hypothetical protein [Kazachstania saulgeensis]